jgi:hypothetical protein
VTLLSEQFQAEPDECEEFDDDVVVEDEEEPAAVKQDAAPSTKPSKALMKVVFFSLYDCDVPEINQGGPLCLRL